MTSGVMKTTFSIGDLLRVKPSSDLIQVETGNSLFGKSGLVLVLKLSESPGLFHGYTCDTGVVRFWSHDQFTLISKGDNA
jgi:hypothetical protein